MRVSVLLAGLVQRDLRSQVRSWPTVKAIATSANLSARISKAEQSIAACDRLIGDAKVTGPDRAIAFQESLRMVVGQKRCGSSTVGL